MFFFTLILVLAYAVAIGTAFTGTEPKIDNFPALDPGMVALFGISHAGYLVHKAVPHSQTRLQWLALRENVLEVSQP
jgi:hypothetical protein